MALRQDSGAPDRGRSRHTAWGLALLLLAAVALAVGANLWKRDLKLQEVRTQGNRIVPSAEILTLAGIKRNQRLFEVDLNTARRRVQGNQFIRSVAVTRNVPGTVTISVQERTPVAALALERILYLDAEGVVLPAARSEFIYDLPVLTGALPAAECVPGRRVQAPALREALELLLAAQALGDEVYRSISEVHLDGERNIIVYTADAGVPVVVGRGDAPRKLVKFEGFWKDVVSRQGAQDLEYVDLRFEDQVVARWKQGIQQAAH